MGQINALLTTRDDNTAARASQARHAMPRTLSCLNIITISIQNWSSHQGIKKIQQPKQRSIPAANSAAHPPVSHQLRSHTGIAPPGGVDDDAHQTPRDDARHGQGDDPAKVDPRDHAPVDGAPGARAEADADGGARDALRGGDGEFWRGESGLVRLLFLLVVVVLLEQVDGGTEREREREMTYSTGWPG